MQTGTITCVSENGMYVIRWEDDAMELWPWQDSEVKRMVTKASEGKSDKSSS